MRNRNRDIKRGAMLAGGVGLLSLLVGGLHGDCSTRPATEAGHAPQHANVRAYRPVQQELGWFRLEEIKFSGDLRIQASGIFHNASGEELRLRPGIQRDMLECMSFWAVGEQVVYRMETSPSSMVDPVPFEKIRTLPRGSEERFDVSTSVWARNPAQPSERAVGYRFAKRRTDGPNQAATEYIDRLPAGTYGVRCDLELPLVTQEGTHDSVTFPSTNMLWITVADQTGASSLIPSGKAIYRSGQ